MNATDEVLALRQLTTVQFDPDELIALVSALEIRQKDHLIYELLVPLSTGGAIILTERVFRPAWLFVRRKAKAIFARSAVAATANALAITGPQGAAIATAVDIALLCDVCLSIGMDVNELWSNYPGPDEASRYLPAEVTVIAEAQAALDSNGTSHLFGVTQQDVALATAYVVHCSSLPADNSRKLMAMQALFVGYQFGYMPRAYQPLVIAARRLKPYTGGDFTAVVDRMEQCLGLYARFGGSKLLSSGRKAIRWTKWAITGYNAYIVAQANVKMALRYVPEGAIPYVIDMSLEFLASPSSFDLQLPFKLKDESAPTIHTIDGTGEHVVRSYDALDQAMQQAAPATSNMNQWIQTADSTSISVFGRSLGR